MGLYRAQVILPFFTNLPRDVIVNQFHFELAEVDEETELITVADRLEVFYKSIYTTVAAGLVNWINWNGAYIKVFRLADAPPRIPYERTLNYAVTPTGVGVLPTEVACVLSWQAAPVSGVIYQRLYNRIFLGGMFGGTITGSSSSQFPRFTSTYTTTVGDAASALLAANTSDVLWVQVSNAGGSPVSREIVGGWVDNSPDTQRRRSVDASVRDEWS